MQTLWDFEQFPMGYGADYFQEYLQRFANWCKLPDLELSVCNPATPSPSAGCYDLSGRLIEYFKDGSGVPGATEGYVTNTLAEAAGYKLTWTMKPRVLRVEPGQWLTAAPLPETNPADFLFWYCPTIWGSQKNTGGNLTVTPTEGEGQEFTYRGGLRGVMVHGMPHLLQAINEKATSPYYCLYGQLREAE